MNRLFQLVLDSIHEVCIQFLQCISNALNKEIEVLAGRIRHSVYCDIHKMYTNTEFETNIHSEIGNVNGAGAFVSGLKSFIDQGIKAVKKELEIKR
ncbi:hypothetical protein [Labilibaculum sp.]|uniref:hypothetical protein n=1 Tax=Labilibaculum sp. TaxID=2060723 RepID=UPI002AA951D4|nr:hypothetical protein [Labilibaculum sp.]